MINKIPIKKLLRTALFSSPAIGALVFAPIYIVGYALVRIFAPVALNNLLNTLPISIYWLIPFGIVVITIFIFSFWIVNICLTYFFSKYIPETSHLYNIKFPISHILCYLTFLVLRFKLMLLITYLTGKQTSIYELRNISFDNSHMYYLRYLIMLMFTISANVIIIMMQNMILLEKRVISAENENAKLKIINIEAVNHRLIQQIHPHFLFNSLSTLKSLIIKGDRIKAASYLVKLSDFLRSSINFNNTGTISLKDELKFSTDYLEMQKVRYGDSLQYSINIPEKEKITGYVPVFSLQLLIENAIKHNTLTLEKPLYIQIGMEKDWIVVINNLQRKIMTDVSTGTGLVNLSERYKLLTGEDIMIRNDDNQFSVSLKTIQNENSNHRG